MSMFDYCIQAGHRAAPGRHQFQLRPARTARTTARGAIESFIEWTSPNTLPDSGLSRCASCCRPATASCRAPMPRCIFTAGGPVQAGSTGTSCPTTSTRELRRDMDAASRTLLASRLTFTLTDPAGRQLHDRREPGDPSRLGTPLYGSSSSHRWTLTRGVFFILLPPTAKPSRPGRSRPPAPIEIKLEQHRRDSPPSAYVDAWVARDDTVPGYPQFGRQFLLQRPAVRSVRPLQRPHGADGQQQPGPTSVHHQRHRHRQDADRDRRLPAQGDEGGRVHRGGRAQTPAAAAALARRHGAVRRHLRAGRPAGGRLPQRQPRRSPAPASPPRRSPSGWRTTSLPAARATARRCGTRPTSTRPIRRPTRRRRPGRPSRPRNAAATAASGAGPLQKVKRYEW